MSQPTTIAAICCPQCRSPIPPAQFNQDADWTCFLCGCKLQVRVFPALLRAAQPGRRAEPLINEGDSSCYYHPTKLAVQSCEHCGRFICALCDIPMGSRHVCPSCIKPDKYGSDETDNHRTLYDSVAIVLAILPLIVTPLLALCMAAKIGRRPVSVTKRSGFWWLLAVILACGQLGIWCIVLLNNYISGGGVAK